MTDGHALEAVLNRVAELSRDLGCVQSVYVTYSLRHDLWRAEIGCEDGNDAAVERVCRPLEHTASKYPADLCEHRWLETLPAARLDVQVVHTPESEAHR